MQMGICARQTCRHANCNNVSNSTAHPAHLRQVKVHRAPSSGRLPSRPSILGALLLVRQQTRCCDRATKHHGEVQTAHSRHSATLRGARLPATAHGAQFSTTTSQTHLGQVLVLMGGGRPVLRSLRLLPLPADGRITGGSPCRLRAAGLLWCAVGLVAVLVAAVCWGTGGLAAVAHRATGCRAPTAGCSATATGSRAAAAGCDAQAAGSACGCQAHVGVGVHGDIILAVALTAEVGLRGGHVVECGERAGSN